jgi:AcrR family transcriptional regulator
MEQTIDTRDRIREQARNLFLRYGIRSVSMDDIAVGIGMSKKTIYQWFKDKDELVDAMIMDEISQMQTETKNCFVHSKDAVEEIFLTMDQMLDHMRNINPTIMYDLHKFHFQSFKKFTDHKNTYLLEVISKNLERGIKEGLYRSGLDVDVLSRFRLESMMIPFNMDVFPASKYNLVEVTTTLIEHFVFGIVTQEGYSLILTYQQERKNKSKQK